MTEEILIPVIPNVECRDGKEIGVWMEGWLQGYKEAQSQYEAKETLYTEEEVLQLLLRLQQTESYDNLYEWFKQFKKK